MQIGPSADNLLRYALATVVGALIGLNREIRHKPAGCAPMRWLPWALRSPLPSSSGVRAA
jgi:hypothetical protein